jgi:hypothetical protein
MMTEGMATESTEKHGQKEEQLELSWCFCVDSVANNEATGAQLNLYAPVRIKLKAYWTTL